MGVQGLWNLLESSGQPVPIHTLRGKVLAIDVSIWLHQAVKGFRDKNANPLPNAHLVGLFHRICKLLNYGIKPVFVFDGGVPVLKRQTMNARRQKKIEAHDKSEETRTKLLTNLIQQQVQRQTKNTLTPTQQLEKGLSSLSPKKKSESPKKRSRPRNEDSDEDEFAKLRKKLEENESLNNSFVSALFSSDNRNSASVSADDSSDSSEVDQEDYRRGRNYADHFSSITSPNFDTLPLELQHEILFQMQESKKTNSWGKMHEMPKDLQNFSSFQMDRLVKRRFLQKKIQTVQKEMGERHIHVQDLDDLANYEAEFGDSATPEIIGSKESGALLIKAKPIATSSVQKPGPSTKSNLKTNHPEVITIDDFVEDWESEDEIIEESPRPSTSTQSASTSAHSSQGIPKSMDSMEEDAELELAIAMSLENVITSQVPRQQQQDAIGSMIKPLSPENSVVRSPTKLVRSTSESSKEAQIQPTLFPTEFQTGNSACFKFLGWVGFSENIQAASQSAPKVTCTSSAKPIIDIEDSSTSGSDFEEVCDDVKLEAKEDSKSKVVDLIPTSGQAKVGIPVSIVLDENFVQFKKEEDIFADIFKDPQESVENVEVIVESNNINATNVDLKISEELQAGQSSRSLTADCIDDRVEGIDEMMDEEFGLNFEDADEIAHVENQKVDSVVARANSPHEGQQITRTLGTLPSQSVRVISSEYLQTQQKLNDAQRNLRSALGNQERVAQSITDQMYLEAQELLSIFGIPFVVSPMEAESQCAFLDSACLTDGTITDDSDVWLFGGQRVYKNFFLHGEKPVQFFQYADIVQNLNLDREKLILIAMLTGSDYTTGVAGVGPVLALEILAEFNGESAFDSLVKFREWWDLTQELAISEAVSKIRAKFRKLKLRQGFPSKAVYDAYMDPTIDTSTELFRWGSPDLDSVRSYTKNKFGWENTKCDATLGPVLKNLSNTDKPNRQTTMDGFLVKGMPSSFHKMNVKSKRLALAMKKLKKAMPMDAMSEVKLSSSDTDSESEEVLSRPAPRKRKRNLLDKIPELQRSGKLVKTGNEPMTSKARIPKKVDSSIPQKTRAETRNKLLKGKAAELLKRKTAE